MDREIEGLKMEIWGCGMGNGGVRGNWYEMKIENKNENEN